LIAGNQRDDKASTEKARLIRHTTMFDASKSHQVVSGIHGRTLNV